MRNRGIYVVFICAVVLIGLGSRIFSEFLPPFLASYSGDTLWGLMIFLIVGLIFKHKSTLWVWWGAMIFSYSIEFSQLYQAQWINSIRHTMVGGLILGYGFLWSDLICYTVGFTGGAMVEQIVFRKR